MNTFCCLSRIRAKELFAVNIYTRKAKNGISY